MAVPIIPNIVEWTIVPQKGTATFYDDMNVWLAQTNTVVNSWNTTLNSTNAVYQDISFIYNQIQNADPTSGYSQAYTNRSQIAGYSEYKAVGAEISVLTADNTNLQLYKNDVLLVLTTDYTLNVDGVTVDLVAPLVLDDLVQWYDLNKLKNSFYEKSEVYNKTETYMKTETNNLLDNKIDKDINSLAPKPTPDDTDELIIADSAVGFGLKKMTWSVLRATLRDYFDGLYSRTAVIFGIGQILQNLIATRQSGVLYTNTTNKPIQIMISGGVSTIWFFEINNSPIANGANGGAESNQIFAVILPGNTYKFTSSSISAWHEMR